MADGMAIKVDPRQFAALNKSLETLKGPRVNAINRTASTKAIRPVRLDVKQRLRSVSKELSRFADYVVRTYKRSNTVVALVGINNGKLKKNSEKEYPTNVLDLIEFGTEPHTIRAANKKTLALPPTEQDIVDEQFTIFGKTVRHPGSAPTPVLRNAFSSKRTQMESIWANEMAAGVVKEFDKAKKK